MRFLLTFVMGFSICFAVSAFAETGPAGYGPVDNYSAPGTPDPELTRDRDVLWENPFNYGTMTNAYYGYGSYHLQDDFTLTDAATIQGFEWYAVFMGAHPVPFDLHLYPDSGGHPDTGNELWTVTETPDEEDTGYDMWGVDIMHDWIDLDPSDYFDAEGDTVYWLEVHCATSNTFGWATEPGGNIHQNGSQYPDSAFFIVNGSSDEVDPTVTDMYPHDEDFPSGVPVDTDVGWHVLDDASGCDIEATEWSVEDSSSDLVLGTMDIDDSDPLDVSFDFTPDDELIEGETYTVDIAAYDNAGNGPVEETWDFTTGYTNIAPASIGTIKAGYAE